MGEQKIRCIYCESEKVTYNGKNRTGRQRMLCNNEKCEHRTFQLEYKNKGSKPEVKEKILEMAINGAGVRDTGRVLGVSVSTVIKVLKKLKIKHHKLTNNI